MTKVINKGTGAGGANTTKNGGSFEDRYYPGELLDLDKEVFPKKKDINKSHRYSDDITITKQNDLWRILNPISNTKNNQSKIIHNKEISVWDKLIQKEKDLIEAKIYAEENLIELTSKVIKELLNSWVKISNTQKIDYNNKKKPVFPEHGHTDNLIELYNVKYNKGFEDLKQVIDNSDIFKISFLNNSIDKLLKIEENIKYKTCPDVAVLYWKPNTSHTCIENINAIDIIEYKSQSESGSVDTKICQSNYYKVKYMEMFNNYDNCPKSLKTIRYSLVLSDYFRAKHLNGTYRVDPSKLNYAKKEADSVLFAEDCNFKEQLINYIDTKADSLALENFSNLSIST